MKTVTYTNARLTDWYKNLNEEYGVVGEAKCTYNEGTNKIEIKAVENGEELFFSMSFFNHLEVDYYFNVWMENPTEQD